MNKKNILYFAAAIAFAGCTNETLIDDAQNEAKPMEIGFETLTDAITKAENSLATAYEGLSTYHQSFNVWGSKYITNKETSTEDETVVFSAQVVNWNSAAWSYSPIRFWDKSASSYDFYAAAPASDEWTWNNNTKKLSRSNFEVDGTTIAASASVNSQAVMGPNDLMISTDVKDYNTYTSASVNLKFNHILSRFNIGIKKDATLANFDVKLNGIELFNMVNKASFNEASASGTDLSAGTIARWTEVSRFAASVGYTTETLVTDAYNYVYQALVLPQAVKYSAASLNGVGLTALSDPYMLIDYEIWTKDIKYSQDEIDAAKAIIEADGYVTGTDTNAEEVAAKSTNDVKIASYKVDGYKYYYNIADIFQPEVAAASKTAINFCEGWQNTLKIILKPALISFTADVYEWADKTTTEVEVPDMNDPTND